MIIEVSETTNGYPMHGAHAVYWLKMVHAKMLIERVDTKAYFVFIIQAWDIDYH